MATMAYAPLARGLTAPHEAVTARFSVVDIALEHRLGTGHSSPSGAFGAGTPKYVPQHRKLIEASGTQRPTSEHSRSTGQPLESFHPCHRAFPRRSASLISSRQSGRFSPPTSVSFHAATSYRSKGNTQGLDLRPRPLGFVRVKYPRSQACWVILSHDRIIKDHRRNGAAKQQPIIHHLRKSSQLFFHA